jgi:hypothetical protein
MKLGRTLLRQQRYAESETELLVDDLVTLYDATHRPEQAATFRVKSNTR